MTAAAHRPVPVETTSGSISHCTACGMIWPCVTARVIRGALVEVRPAGVRVERFSKDRRGYVWRPGFSVFVGGVEQHPPRTFREAHAEARALRALATNNPRRTP